jgi:hypothetical protein
MVIDCFVVFWLFYQIPFDLTPAFGHPSPVGEGKTTATG